MAAAGAAGAPGEQAAPALAPVQVSTSQPRAAHSLGEQWAKPARRPKRAHHAELATVSHEEGGSAVAGVATPAAQARESQRRGQAAGRW